MTPDETQTSVLAAGLKGRCPRCGEGPLFSGGLTLRFARVKRYRTDKLPGDADTIDTIRALYAASIQ